MQSGQEPDDPTPWVGMSVAQRYRSSLGDSGPLPMRRDGVLAPFRTRLLITDAGLLAVAMIVGLLISARASTWAIDPLLAVYAMPPVITLLWLGTLVIRGAYDQRIIGLGTEEFKRVLSATVVTFSVVAGVSYLFRADISRAYAFVSLPLGLVLIVIGRMSWRGWLYRRRAVGVYMHRTVLVGSGPAADELDARLTRDYFAGYLVVDRVAATNEPGGGTPSWLDQLDAIIAAKGVEAVAVTPSDSLSADAIRQLAWRLEGRSIDLLIAPGLMDVAGPRLSVRPAAGVPLLQLDEASLSRPQAFAKRALDLVGGLAFILILWPVMLGCAVAVKATSKGPALFRQPRIGRAGRAFTMLKIRTMVDHADEQVRDLRASNGQDQPMFKVEGDPRVTRVGRFLRRWSLDELPQLFNVVGGSMSLVGPRPHPVDDVDRYEIEAYHRLALKPGLTGLWQVQGRSTLTWSEALQLDLYYVETWSLAGDLVLLARTVRAVIQGRGAF